MFQRFCNLHRDGMPGDFHRKTDRLALRGVVAGAFPRSGVADHVERSILPVESLDYFDRFLTYTAGRFDPGPASSQ
jgi:hypothetical protein